MTKASSFRVAAFLLWVAQALACQSPSKPRPVAVPEGIQIPVEIDGKEASPLSTQQLRGIAPDYVAGDRFAWRLGALLGPSYTRPDSVLEVEQADGVKLLFTRPAEKIDGQEPVLALNRRGDVLVALMKPDNPFPSFHGRGGNRGREGDPSTRIHGIKRIRLFLLPRGTEGSAEGKPKLAPPVKVVVKGRPETTWTQEDFDEVEPLEVMSESGDEEQEAWPVRPLAEQLIGPKARLVRVRGENGHMLEIKPEEWRQQEKIPVLRLNRRGLIKFQWVSASKEVTPKDEGLRGVSQLDFEL
ncbi:MAG: hypothetical protein ACOZIN_15575 [Myxococcota bacterium]